MIALRAVAILQFCAALSPMLLYALLASFAGLQGETALWLVGRVVFPFVALVEDCWAATSSPWRAASILRELARATRACSTLWTLPAPAWERWCLALFSSRSMAFCAAPSS